MLHHSSFTVWGLFQISIHTKVAQFSTLALGADTEFRARNGNVYYTLLRHVRRVKAWDCNIVRAKSLRRQVLQILLDCFQGINP
jgi:hypothetical protein